MRATRLRRGLPKETEYIEEGLEIEEFPSMGRGLVAKKSFNIGDFVCEYKGELITAEEGYERELPGNGPSYLYFFQWREKKLCIDATAEDDSFGRLINHSWTGNLKPRVVTIHDQPKIFFYASAKIDIGQQLFYSYGERRKEIIDRNPWLQHTKKKLAKVPVTAAKAKVKNASVVASDSNKSDSQIEVLPSTQVDDSCSKVSADTNVVNLDSAIKTTSTTTLACVENSTIVPSESTITSPRSSKDKGSDSNSYWEKRKEIINRNSRLQHTKKKLAKVPVTAAKAKVKNASVVASNSNKSDSQIEVLPSTQVDDSCSKVSADTNVVNLDSAIKTTSTTTLACVENSTIVPSESTITSPRSSKDKGCDSNKSASQIADDQVDKEESFASLLSELDDVSQPAFGSETPGKIVTSHKVEAVKRNLNTMFSVQVEVSATTAVDDVTTNSLTCNSNGAPVPAAKAEVTNASVPSESSESCDSSKADSQIAVSATTAVGDVTTNSLTCNSNGAPVPAAKAEVSNASVPFESSESCDSGKADSQIAVSATTAVDDVTTNSLTCNSNGAPVPAAKAEVSIACVPFESSESCDSGKADSQIAVSATTAVDDVTTNSLTCNSNGAPVPAAKAEVSIACVPFESSESCDSGKADSQIAVSATTAVDDVTTNSLTCNSNGAPVPAAKAEVSIACIPFESSESCDSGKADSQIAVSATTAVDDVTTNSLTCNSNGAPVPAAKAEVSIACIPFESSESCDSGKADSQIAVLASNQLGESCSKSRVFTEMTMNSALCAPKTNNNSDSQLQSPIGILPDTNIVNVDNVMNTTTVKTTLSCGGNSNKVPADTSLHSSDEDSLSDTPLFNDYGSSDNQVLPSTETNVSAAKNGVTFATLVSSQRTNTTSHCSNSHCSKGNQCEIKEDNSNLPLAKSKASRRSSKPNYVLSSTDDDGDFNGDSSDDFTPKEEDSESEVSSESEASDTTEPKTNMQSSTTTAAKKRKTVLELDLSDDREDSDTTESERNFKSSTTTESSERKRVKEHGLGNKTSEAKTCKEQEPSSASGTVKVQKINKKRIVNKRDWSKQYACYYCGMLRSKPMEHYESQHAEEKEVANILALPVNSKERRAAIAKLRAAGAFKHNQKCITSGEGVLQVKRRCKRSDSPTKYQTCPYCGESMKLVSRHKKKCALKPSKGSIKSSGTQLMSRNPNEFHKDVFLNVILKESRSKDEIFHLIKNDELLVEFGASLVEHHSNKSQQYNNIRNKLRNCGRFLRAIKSLDPTIKCFEDAITPMKFDLCIQATQQEAGFDLSTNTFKTPSVAKRIGELLEAIAVLLQKRAIKTQNEAMQKRIKDFITLREMDWSSKVSSKASLQLKELRYNKAVPLPDKDDTIKLADYLESHTEKAMKSLEEIQTSKQFNDLTQVTLARVMVFNRKRPGDVHNLTVETYLQKTNEQKTHQSIWDSLGPEEQAFVKSLKRVETRGKQQMKVSILFTASMQQAVNLLLKYRDLCSIPASNRYLFPNVGCETHMRGTDALRECVKKAGCQHPERVTATCLRKEAATLAKISGLSEIQVKELAEFLGHSLRTHNEVYRLPEATLQTAKVSKYLTQIYGNQSSGNGKDNIEDTQSVDGDLEENDIVEETDNKKPSTSHKRKRADSSSSSSSSEKFFTPKKKKGTKRKWDTPQVKAIKKHFDSDIRLGRLPSKAECERARRESALKSRTWGQIRDKVRNESLRSKRHCQ